MSVGVTWVFTNQRLASARLRDTVPAAVLRARGLIHDGTDVIVASKHRFSAEKVRAATPRMIMDVCDDHFGGVWRDHYLRACDLADEVTVNSAAMAAIVKRETGRSPIVIDDPYEDPELPPSGGDGVLWFGHSLNLPTLTPYDFDYLGYPLTVIDSSNWSPERLDAELRRCRCVFIPTAAEKPAKSANRAIKAIRYGKMPVCGPLPAHAELGLGKRPILDVLDYAMHADTAEIVRGLQDAIRVRFSPETVADAWWKVLR